MSRRHDNAVVLRLEPGDVLDMVESLDEATAYIIELSDAASCQRAMAQLTGLNAIRRALLSQPMKWIQIREFNATK